MTEAKPTRSPITRLAARGLVLPPLPAPIGLFRLGQIEGSLLFLSGQGPVLPDGRLATGRVGRDLSAERARVLAMHTGLTLLSAASLTIGGLDRIAGVVKVLGFVNATDDFDRHPFVIDGCSELFLDLFGAAGAHARSAIGVASLPGGIPIEIEAIFRIR